MPMHYSYFSMLFSPFHLFCATIIKEHKTLK